jgi:hypothetical protein
MKVDEAMAILRYELQQKPELVTVFHVIQDALAQPEHWGASAVGHPAYVAAQKRRTEELRSRLDQMPVQVSPLEFVTMTLEKEHLIGKPIFWAEWPNREQGGV